MDEEDEMGLGSMKEVTRDSEGVIVEPLDLEDGSNSPSNVVGAPGAALLWAQ